MTPPPLELFRKFIRFGRSRHLQLFSSLYLLPIMILILGMLGRLEISRTITFLSTVGEFSQSSITFVVKFIIDCQCDFRHSFNVFSSYDQREQTLSEPLLRDFTNVDRGTRGDFFSISFCLSGWLCFCLFFLFVKDKHSQIPFRAGEMVRAAARAPTSKARRSNRATCQEKGLRRRTGPGKTHF